MVKNSGKFIPDQGDFIWLDLEPTRGHEQRGHRPVLVLSPSGYNEKGILLCVPVTSKPRVHPFAVLVNEGKIKGTVLSDQV